MNVQERVLAALRREEPDRVPVFIYLNPYTKEWYTSDPSYSALLDACKEHADVIHDWYLPMGFLASAAELPRESRTLPGGLVEDTLHTPAGPVTRVMAPDWRGMAPRKRWMSTVQDARRILSIPSVRLRPDLRPFLADRERLAGKAVSQVTLPDPVGLVVEEIDPEAVAVWTLEQRPLLREMLDVAYERIAGLLEYCLKADLGPIYYFNGPEYALPPLMSPRDFEEFVVEYDAPLVRLIHSYPGKYAIIHSHGRVNRFLERFAAIGMDGLNVLEPPPVGDTVLAEAKRHAGKSYCLIGNIQYDDLVRKDKPEVEQLVFEAIRQAGPEGGFILFPMRIAIRTPAAGEGQRQSDPLPGHGPQTRGLPAPAAIAISPNPYRPAGPRGRRPARSRAWLPSGWLPRSAARGPAT